MGQVTDFRKIKHTLRIRHQGVFDMKGLFKVIRNWFLDHSYEFHETDIKHKVPSPAGYEEEYLMHGDKEVNAYVKFKITVHMIIYDIKDVEVVRDGKKHKLTQGSLNMELWATIEYDYQNRFQGSTFLKNLMNFMNRYVIKKSLDIKWEDELYYRVYKLHKAIKEYLDFETKTNAY